MLDHDLRIPGQHRSTRCCPNPVRRGAFAVIEENEADIYRMKICRRTRHTDLRELIGQTGMKEYDAVAARCYAVLDVLAPANAFDREEVLTGRELLEDHNIAR